MAIVHGAFHVAVNTAKLDYVEGIETAREKFLDRLREDHVAAPFDFRHAAVRFGERLRVAKVAKSADASVHFLRGRNDHFGLLSHGVREVGDFEGTKIDGAAENALGDFVEGESDFEDVFAVDRGDESLVEGGNRLVIDVEAFVLDRFCFEVARFRHVFVVHDDVVKKNGGFVSGLGLFHEIKIEELAVFGRQNHSDEAV